MKEEVVYLSKKFYQNLCVYRNYYDLKDVNDDMNTFYLNASFIYTISDFERELSNFLNSLIKSDDYYKRKFDLLINLTKSPASPQKSFEINDLVLFSKHRIIVIADLILNDKYDIKKLQFKRDNRKMAFVFPKGESLWCFSSFNYGCTNQESGGTPNNKINSQFARLLFFFDEAYERRNSLVHRSGFADRAYLQKSKMSSRDKYVEPSKADEAKKYLIDNMLFRQYENDHARNFKKAESYKENLIGIDLVVNPQYYSHVIMTLQQFIFYYINLCTYEKKFELIENYFKKILFYCANFTYYIKNAERKIILENCKNLVFDFLRENTKKIKDKDIFPYCLYIVDKYDQLSTGSESYQELMNLHDQEIEDNLFANYYHSARKKDTELMRQLLEKMHKEGMIKTSSDIKNNLIFTESIGHEVFRDFCNHKLKDPIDSNDFINKFAQQDK